MADPIRLRLPTRYRIAGELGSGRSATVYLARDTRTGVDVALKVITVDASVAETGERSTPVDSDLFDRAFDRFETETRALSRLRGVPGIQNVLQMGVTDRGEPWIVSEVLAGGSLADRAQGEAQSTSGCTTLARPHVRRLFAVLAQAHELGISHGDISPNNILFDSSGAPVITDFGMAELVDQNRGPVVGGMTPAFAAPERIRGAAPSPASDVYALCASIVKSAHLDDLVEKILVNSMSADPTKRPSAARVTRRLSSRFRFLGA